VTRQASIFFTCSLRLGRAIPGAGKTVTCSSVAEVGVSDGSLSAPYTVEFGFERTTGPVIGAFLAGLRDGVLYGVRTASGAVLCPVTEFDPETEQETGELVPLEPAGTVLAWTWVAGQAWGLIRIDGTAGSLFHLLEADGNMTALAAGLRVRARWREREQRAGAITDIEFFVAVG
jgi:uncharacterized protein